VGLAAGLALIDQATLAEVLAGASSDAEVPPIRGFQLVIALMRLERAGRHHDLVEHRRRLQSLKRPALRAVHAHAIGGAKVVPLIVLMAMRTTTVR